MHWPSSHLKLFLGTVPPVPPKSSPVLPGLHGFIAALDDPKCLTCVMDMVVDRRRLISVVAGYLNNIWRADDLLILVHCPEAPRLPTFSFKSKVYIKHLH